MAVNDKTGVSTDPGRGYAWLLRMGKRKVVALLTVVSVGASLLLTAASLWLGLSEPPTPSVIRWSLIVATLVPLIIAPVVAILSMNILIQLQGALELVQKLALTDSLTGLDNRRSFMESAESALAGSRNGDEPVSAIMIDIDDFKAINDTFGHFVGDKVLIAVAAACARCVRQTDIVARFGGEEFSVLLPDCPLAEALAIAESIRQQVEEIVSVGAAERVVKVRVSIGVASLSRNIHGLSELLHAADKHLYEAKRSGRNRVWAGAATDRDAAYNPEPGKRPL